MATEILFGKTIKQADEKGVIINDATSNFTIPSSTRTTVIFQKNSTATILTDEVGNSWLTGDELEIMNRSDHVITIGTNDKVIFGDDGTELSAPYTFSTKGILTLLRSDNNWLIKHRAYHS